MRSIASGPAAQFAIVAGMRDHLTPGMGLRSPSWCAYRSGTARAPRSPSGGPMPADWPKRLIYSEAAPITNAYAGPSAVRPAGYRYGNARGNVQNPFLSHPTSQRHFPPYQNLTAIRA
jgi:hypothetical protein